MGNCCGGEAKAAQAVPGGKPLLRNKTQRLGNWRATGVIALRDANLKEIPEQVADVGAVARSLDASNNKLSELPPFLFDLTSLQRLILASNQLPALPTAVGQLTNLRVLILDANLLTELPGSIASLGRLERLSAASNALGALPGSMGGMHALRELVVRGNKLRALPEDLGMCAALEVVDVSDNYLQALPASLGRLSALQSLNCDSNRVAAVPSQLLTGCRRLQTLSLHGNPITPNMLQATMGYEEFDARRRGKYDKQIAGGMHITGGLDEGVDR